MDALTSLVLFFIIVSLLTFGIVAIRVTASYAERGWSAHYSLMNEMKDHMIVRISTLENKLMSHSWQEFANLQEVSDEATKVTQLNIAKENVALDREGWITRQQELDGDNLEGELFEGPTLG